MKRGRGTTNENTCGKFREYVTDAEWDEAKRDVDILFLYGLREKARLTEKDSYEIEDLFEMVTKQAIGVE